MGKFYDEYLKRTGQSRMAPWLGAPAWVKHLSNAHPELYPVARRLAELWATEHAWPTRRRLFTGLQHRYPNATAMEEALAILDGRFTARIKGEAIDVLDGAGPMTCPEFPCGTPVYRFEVLNKRGPKTIHYGLSPFFNVLDRSIGVKDRIRVSRIIEPDLDDMVAEIEAWQRLIASGKCFEPEAYLEMGSLLEMGLWGRS